MRPTVSALILALALVMAPTAAAKEIQGGSVCGADGCRATGALPFEAIGLSPPGTDLPTPEPWYRIRLRMGAGDQVLQRIRVLWAPKQKLIAYDERNPRWFPAPAVAVRIARRITRGVEPFPAATMPMHFVPVRVDEVIGPVRRPATVSADAGGGAPWAPIAAAALAALAAGLGAARYRSRRAKPRSASAPTSAT
jgi:hypothetical protein